MGSAERGAAYIDASRAKGPPFPSVFLDDVGLGDKTDYLVKGLLDRSGMGLIYGASGSGKTFFTIDLAGHIANGMDWRGKRVHQALTVYIAAEAGPSILKRTSAWRDIKLGEAREDRVPFKIICRGANLLDDVETAQLMAALESISIEVGMPIGLVVIDTLSRSIPGGDENSAQDMTRVIQVTDRIRDELKAATLVVHHAGKDATRGARGSSSLHAAADCVISIADGVATVTKSRDGLSGEEFPFRLNVISLGTDEDGDPVSTCVVEHQNETTRPKGDVRLSDHEKTALAALKEALGEHGTDLPETSTIPRCRGVKVDQWRETFYMRSGENVDRKNGAEVKAFQRARSGLIANKIVGASTPWVWLW